MSDNKGTNPDPKPKPNTPPPPPPPSSGSSSKSDQVSHSTKNKKKESQPPPKSQPQPAPQRAPQPAGQPASGQVVTPSSSPAASSANNNPPKAKKPTTGGKDQSQGSAGTGRSVGGSKKTPPSEFSPKKDQPSTGALKPKSSSSSSSSAPPPPPPSDDAPGSPLSSRSPGSALTPRSPDLNLKSKGAQYHCDYCRKDITDSVRIKCAECADFDLCVYCFSIGVEVPPHKSTHNYRVMHHVKDIIFETEWGADEELLLLEGIEMFGLGNWSDVAEHVGTKSKAKCELHFTNIYLDSKRAPLPISLLDDKAAKDKGEIETPAVVQDKRQASIITDEKDQKSSSTSTEPPIPKRKSTGALHPLRLERPDPKTTKHFVPEIPPEIPKSALHPSLLGHSGLVGFLPERGDFETEWENDSELVIADMEFKDEDTPMERELKLKVLHIYSKKLNGRQKRKNFVMERGLLYNKDKKRIREEREIYNNTRIFARFHSQEDHEKFLQGLYNEQRIRKRIKQLQNLRLNGIRTIAEGDTYEQEKKKREVQSNFRKQNSYLYPQTQETHLRRRQISEQDKQKEAKRRKLKRDPLDISRMDGVSELTAAEKQLCSVLHLEPRDFFTVKDAITKECVQKGFLKKGKTRQLITVDVNKTAKIFDQVISTGWVKPQPSKISHRAKAAVTASTGSSTSSSVTVAAAPSSSSAADSSSSSSSGSVSSSTVTASTASSSSSSSSAASTSTTAMDTSSPDSPVRSSKKRKLASSS